MSLKANLIIAALLLLAIIFVPFVPNDAPINCDSYGTDCDDGVGYVSVYTKYVKMNRE
jgi:hypothetical protein